MLGVTLVRPEFIDEELLPLLLLVAEFLTDEELLPLFTADDDLPEELVLLRRDEERPLLLDRPDELLA